MRIDDVGALPPDSVTHADVCIVGSGPAGLVLAEELAREGRRVFVLESGNLAPRSDADALNEIRSVGAPRVLDQTLVRNRTLGGTSSSWSGRVATFDDMDFAVREWIPHSGWPFERSALTRFFSRAREYLMAPLVDNNDRAETAAFLSDRPDFDDRHLRNYVWSFSTDATSPNDFMRFGPRAQRQPMPGVTCFLNATVTHINTSDDRTCVESVEVTGQDRRRRVVRSSCVVLCAGGIENARLLLASDRVQRAGLGNVHDQVGRYLMDHPRGAVGRFRPQDHVAVQSRFASYRVRRAGKTYVVTPGVALSSVAQRTRHLANCSAWASGDPSVDDPFVALAALARRHGRPLEQLRRVGRGSGHLVRGARSILVERRSPPRRVRDLELQCMVEQIPDPQSRVTLSTEEKDPYGIPLSQIDWRFGETEWRTVKHMTELIASEFAKVGLPVPEFDDAVLEGSALRLPDVAHPTGTTRMSLSPTQGVVDPSCQVHGIHGLYVAGSSVFPTSGHANPTQTILALTLRLADHLQTELTADDPFARATLRSTAAEGAAYPAAATGRE